MEEFDELAFLFGVQVRPHGDELGLVVFIEVDLLSVSCRLKLDSPSALTDSGTPCCSSLALRLNCRISSLQTIVSATFALSVAQAMERL